MPEIKMRPKHQVTLPAKIVRQANLNVDDRLNVEFTNGVITLTPKKSTPLSQSFNLDSYAGILKNAWGSTTEEVDQFVRDLRS
jgi:antitoxin component of MazEF toxin-antitoxin module